MNLEQLLKSMTNVTPNDEQIIRIEKVRESYKEVARTLYENFFDKSSKKYSIGGRKLMKKLLIVLFIFLLSMSVYADTGYKKDNPDNFKVLKKDILKAYSTEPVITSFDLSAKMPMVMDQGNLGSCASCSVGYYLNGYLQGQDCNWYTKGSRFSPSFLYNFIKNYQSTTGGTSFGDNLNVLLNQGGCQWGYMPYTINSTVKPITAAVTDAAKYKISTYGLVSNTPDDIESFKAWLTTMQIPICIGIPISADFNTINSSNQVYDVFESNTFYGYHAITIVGFDDNKQAFKFVNSWGSSWGLSGYGWISYNKFLPDDIYGYSALDLESGDQLKYDEVYISSYAVSSPNYVGTQWKFYINGKKVSKGTKYYTTNPKITLKVVEDDPTLDDITIITKTLNYGSNTFYVTVKENGGKYKGKTVKIKFCIVRL